MGIEIGNWIGNSNEHSKFNRNYKWNQVVISMNTCSYFNETPMDINWKSSWNFNDISMKIPMKMPRLKLIGNPVEISMKFELKSIGNPVEIQ